MTTDDEEKKRAERAQRMKDCGEVERKAKSKASKGRSASSRPGDSIVSNDDKTLSREDRKAKEAGRSRRDARDHLALGLYVKIL